MTIRLQAEARKRAVASIKRYFAEQGEEVGDLKAELFLDFSGRRAGRARRARPDSLHSALVMMKSG
ncbi:MAG: DUF2164 family protein [Candidatus Latescibacterota bacterium]|nr:MAG: DUF2164 family protein [Candidatus Latescibacterota bacterium]